MKPFSGFSYYMAFEIGALNRLLYREKESEWGLVLVVLAYANSGASVSKIAEKANCSVYRVRKVKEEYGEFFRHKHWEVLLPFLAQVETNASEERYGWEDFPWEEQQKRARFREFLKKAIDN